MSSRVQSGVQKRPAGTMDVIRSVHSRVAWVAHVVVAEAAIAALAHAIRILDEDAGAVTAGDRGGFHALAFTNLARVQAHAARGIFRNSWARCVIQHEPAFIAFL